MPKKKAVDSKKLIKMVKNETPQPEIMKAFGFKTSVQLKSAYMNALIEAGEVPAITKARGTAKAVTTNEVTVGKRGSVIIPKGLVEELGFVENDRFLVRKTKAGISLKRLY
jgi:AbrB family looped-hinge helix DNA binding protein